jgi:hypothetical protein
MARSYRRCNVTGYHTFKCNLTKSDVRDLRNGNWPYVYIWSADPCTTGWSATLKTSANEIARVTTTRCVNPNSGS